VLLRPMRLYSILVSSSGNDEIGIEIFALVGKTHGIDDESLLFRGVVCM